MLPHAKLSRSRFCLTLLLLCSCLSTAAFGDDRGTIRSVVNDFYKHYAGAKDPEKFIKSSDQLTRGFKAAYTSFMKKEADSDPIVGGQDIPRSGYHAGDIALKGKSATVTVTTADKGFPPLKVHVVEEGEKWLINGVNNLRAK